MARRWENSSVYPDFEYDENGGTDADGQYNEYRVIGGDGEIYSFADLEFLHPGQLARLVKDSREPPPPPPGGAQALEFLASIAREWARG